MCGRERNGLASRWRLRQWGRLSGRFGGIKPSYSINDLSTEKQFGPGLCWLREHEIRSYCVLPLTTFCEKLGARGFGSKRAHAFNSYDLEFLHRVAEMVAPCVDHTLPEATLADERARLRLL